MKKVLLILYYWPPAGGPGVQRWLKFVKYLKHFDIELILYKPSNPHYPLIDESLVEEIPEVKTYSLPIKEPYQLASKLSSKKTSDMSAGILSSTKTSLLARFMLFIRGNFFIPDARKSWVKPSVNYLKPIIEKEGIDTIITTGPPHSLHLIGMKLKERHKLKWLADFRDPWTTIHYHNQLKLSSRAKKKHLKLESKVLNAADAIVVTSPSTLKDFKQITPKPIHLITNGFDTELTDELPLDQKFSVTHIGSLLSKRNPKVLWTALSELISEVEGFKEDLQLTFVGKTDSSILNELRAYKLDEYCNNVGYVSHQEAIAYQLKSQLLLLLESYDPNVAQIIPGKLFEYLSAKRPIIAIGPQNWDVDDVLVEARAGTSYTFDDQNSLKSDILTYYKLYKRGELTLDAQDIAIYHRKALTEKLSKILWEL